MIGGDDVIPTLRVDALFGKDATQFAERMGNGQYRNGYGIGDYTLMYVTHRGFFVAASYYNVKQFQGGNQDESDKKADSHNG